MIQLTSDEETSSGEHSLWLQRQSKTMFQSVMRQRSKLLLELLSGPSPNDFWFYLSKISHNDTSLFMFICLSKMMFQCANGCLCWRTILPRVSVPRGDCCRDGSHDENIGVNQFALSISHSWDALAVGGLWAQLCYFRLLCSNRKFYFTRVRKLRLWKARHKTAR
jgi:hypothetical protein